MRPSKLTYRKQELWESMGEYTASYTPEQSLRETYRTLMDMTRSMLDQAGIPPSFWAEAFTTAVEIRNLISIAKNEMKSPLELLNGKIPSVANVRTFGYEAWIHVQDRKKLENKSSQAVSLRSLPHGNYRVWDIEKPLAYTTRNIIINECVFSAQHISQDFVMFSMSRKISGEVESD